MTATVLSLRGCHARDDTLGTSWIFWVKRWMMRKRVMMAKLGRGKQRRDWVDFLFMFKSAANRWYLHLQWCVILWLCNIKKWPKIQAQRAVKWKEPCCWFCYLRVRLSRCFMLTFRHFSLFCTASNVLIQRQPTCRAKDEASCLRLSAGNDEVKFRKWDKGTWTPIVWIYSITALGLAKCSAVTYTWATHPQV